MLKLLPEGMEVVKKLSEGLSMDKEDFESRWTAD